MVKKDGDKIPTVTSEIEQGRKILELSCLVPRVGELGARITQLVKERVNHGVDGRKAFCGCILEQAGNEIDGICIRLSEDLVEGMRLDLRKLVLHVVRVHSSNLLSSRCPQNLDDLHQLVDA